MENLLNYPQSTVVNRIVPKTMFYKFMEVNPRMKTHFVNDVVNITWLYKLSAGTLNVMDSDNLKEIEVFVAQLKQPDCPTDLFSFIDANMPHHIVFILTHENNRCQTESHQTGLNDRGAKEEGGANAMLLINYKDWADQTHTRFKITQTFSSPWVAVTELSLVVDGQSLQRIYDNFVAQISGIGEHKAGTMAEIVTLKQIIAKAEADLLALQKKMRREPQFDVQMQMNKQVKAKRKELEELKQKLEKLK